MRTRFAVLESRLPETLRSPTTPDSAATAALRAASSLAAAFAAPSLAVASLTSTALTAPPVCLGARRRARPKRALGPSALATSCNGWHTHSGRCGWGGVWQVAGGWVEWAVGFDAAWPQTGMDMWWGQPCCECRGSTRSTRRRADLLDLRDDHWRRETAEPSALLLPDE